MARLRTATATSAGGIVVRYEAGRPQLVVGSRRRDRDIRTWTLPKGTPKRDETTEQTAVREVAEETGLVCVLEAELPSTRYNDSRARPKRVRYWRLRVVDGDLDYAHEVDVARWVSATEAESLLTYERDLDVLRALVDSAVPS